MLLQHLTATFRCVVVIYALVTICALYAYYVDSKRPDDDAKKKNYHPLAILFAPVTFPLFLVLSISIFVLRVAAYGVFAVLFIFAMIFIRKPFILELLKKNALIIGDLLMEANTAVVRLFLRPWAGTSGSA